MAGIPSEYLDLFEKPSFAFVATLLPDGAPHVTPTWVDIDGDNVLDSLTGRYTGQPKYPGPSGQGRVVLVVRPDTVSGQSSQSLCFRPAACRAETFKSVR